MFVVEQYETYFNRAKLYTEIHASQKSSTSKPEVKFIFDKKTITPFFMNVLTEILNTNITLGKQKEV